MKVKRLPVDPGPAAWNEILPARTPGPELAEKTTADWLVIGAGFAGLSAARQLTLTRPGDTVVVLEASAVAAGPAGRNSGFMIDLPHVLSSEDYGGDLGRDQLHTRTNRAAIEFATAAAADYGMPAEALVRAGKHNAAATERGLHHNKTYAEHLARLGEPHELLDAAAMKALTGSDYYLGGLYTPGTAMLQPALYTRGLADGLVDTGVRLFESSPVTSLGRNGPDWVATTPNGQVTAPRVILAVNGHAESFGFFERRLMHIMLYASMTRRLTDGEIQTLGGAPAWGCTPSDPMGSTVRRISGIGGDRIIVRNKVSYDPSMEISESKLARMVPDNERSFRARFPMLPDVNMEYRWAGRLCLSRNDVPAFGEIEPGLFAACCQNGLGAAKGTIAGVLAVDLAAGNSSDMLDGILSEPAPDRLPPEPFASIGAGVVLRWKEFKAGREV